MKSGTATKASFIIIPYILWGKKNNILKLKISSKSPKNAKINADPARVNATGKPKISKINVVTNITREKNSGVIIIPNKIGYNFRNDLNEHKKNKN